MTDQQKFSKKTDFNTLSTRADDRVSEEITDFLLSRLIEILSKSINFEFSKGQASQNLFKIPLLQNLDILQKTQLSRDLAELLFNFRHQRDSINIRQSLENLRNFKETTEESSDIIKSLSLSKEIHIPKEETDSLLNLILSVCSDSVSWKNQNEVSLLEEIYINLSGAKNRLMKEASEKSLKRDQKKEKFEKNCREIETLKNKEILLEKHLEDLLIDQFILKEQTTSLNIELHESLNLLSNMN